jgi:hypothetical protein
VIERLFFDGIDAEAGGAAIGCQYHSIVAPGPNEAGAALALMELAKARAEIALNPAIVEPMPEACFKNPFAQNSRQSH